MDFVYISYNPIWLVWIFKHLFYRTPIDECSIHWMLFSLRKCVIFFSEYFYLKNYPKKHVPSFSLPWWEEFHHFFSSCFHNYSLHHHSSKTFLYWQYLKILISLKHYIFNIKHYLRKSYLHKKFFLTYIQTAKLLNIYLYK